MNNKRIATFNSLAPGGRFLHLVAVMATFFTWPLLFVGGLVTTYRVGMAVPDWPTTFGINMFVYDFTNSAWGVFIEHGHRLYGAAVGLGCIILAIGFSLSTGRRAWFPLLVVSAIGMLLGLAARYFRLVDPLFLGILIGGPISIGMAVWFGLVRKHWLVALSWLLLAAVIGQGALGGYRVRLNSTDLAAVHGCTGQLFFAGMVGLCVLTSRTWPLKIKSSPSGNEIRIQWLSLITLVAIYLQIVAGAWLRHYSLGLSVHSSLALIVVGLTLSTIWTAIKGDTLHLTVVPSARFLLITTSIQISLGILSWWLLRPFDGLPKEITGLQAFVRTAHQANGALVLASIVALALRSWAPRIQHSPQTVQLDSSSATLSTSSPSFNPAVY